jgi:alkanesulfonate monooxygenase SsuD/methylene tetrahydromethanopterin reductase-like flavin-dependent oxidoreductase (luciferase family)
MRLGVTLPPDREVELAVAAESVGVPFVHIATAAGTESTTAAAVVAATSSIRVIVSVNIGHEHPVTLAEEIAVVDNLSNGRIGVIAELGALGADHGTEDVTLLRACWSGRPVVHHGHRWRVPAGLPGHDVPPAVMVTPPPAQLAVPLWVAGQAAQEVGRNLSLPVVVHTPSEVDQSTPVAPARAELGGDVDTDREVVIEWSSAGATHLLCALSGPATIDEVVRRLQPEVAMVGFPRVVTDTPLPAPWPGPLRT